MVPLPFMVTVEIDLGRHQPLRSVLSDSSQAHNRALTPRSRNRGTNAQDRGRYGSRKGNGLQEREPQNGSVHPLQVANTATSKTAARLASRQRLPPCACPAECKGLE
jgi:hypothetical protein